MVKSLDFRRNAISLQASRKTIFADATVTATKIYYVIVLVVLCVGFDGRIDRCRR